MSANLDERGSQVSKTANNTQNGTRQKEIVRKGQDGNLPGFEETPVSTTWKSPFFFVQAADTQLGMIVNYGDGTIRLEINEI